MPLPSPPSWLEIERFGDLAIVRFVPALVLTGEKAEAVGDYLLRLVACEAVRRLVLDFGNVRSLTSPMLGKLLRLHNELQAAAGWLALFNLSPDLYAIFEATHLTPILRLYRGEEPAG